MGTFIKHWSTSKPFQENVILPQNRNGYIYTLIHISHLLHKSPLLIGWELSHAKTLFSMWCLQNLSDIHMQVNDLVLVFNVLCYVILNCWVLIIYQVSLSVEYDSTIHVFQERFVTSKAWSVLHSASLLCLLYWSLSTLYGGQPSVHVPQACCGRSWDKWNFLEYWFLSYKLALLHYFVLFHCLLVIAWLFISFLSRHHMSHVCYVVVCLSSLRLSVSKFDCHLLTGWFVESYCCLFIWHRD